MLQTDPKIDGFMQVAAATTIPSIRQMAIAGRWALGIAERRRNNTSAIAAELNSFEWSWPAFDAMVGDLLAIDVWPTPWHHYEKKVKAGADLKDVRSKVLIQSARTASISAKRSQEASFMADIASQGWHLYTDSDVGAWLLKQRMAETVVKPWNWRSWPPLYPGDQSRLERGAGGIHSRNSQF